MKSKNIHADKWIATKIFLTVFLISVFFFKPNLWFSRFELLTKAVAHYGTTRIEEVEQESGIRAMDSLRLNGHTYIEPTPGLSFIALATYVPYVIFFKSRLEHAFSLDHFLELKITQFVMALSTVILLTALLIAVFFLSLRRTGCSKEKAIIFSFLLYVGTPIIYYSLNITNGQDILQTSILFIAFFILSMSEMQSLKLIFLSGLLYGLTIFINVVSLFFFPLFLSIILLAKRWRNFIPWIVGAVIGVTPLLIYNQISFGSLLKTSYSAKYGASFILHLDLSGSFEIARVLLASPMVGLVFFFPLVIMMVPMFRRLWVNRMNKLILSAVLIYIVCLFIGLGSLHAAIGYGNKWWLILGGGGPRYLLPIIPFLLYVIANVSFDWEWKKNLTAVLMFICVIINAPGLFWTGGEFIFFNNLLVFCKNGFHSYMVDLIRDILIRRGFNTSGLSIFPLLTILGIFLCWIWLGNQKLRSLFQ
jgi:hypothetical protein